MASPALGLKSTKEGIKLIKKITHVRIKQDEKINKAYQIG